MLPVTHLTYRFNIIVFLLICFQWGKAQSLLTKKYTMEDGLPSNFVYRAVQDSTGLIWFCTDKGLVKFDGVRFEQFDLDDRLPHNDIFDIHLGKDEKIWLSTFNAVCYIQHDSIHFLDFPHQEKAGLINHRFIGKEHHWIQLRGSTHRYFYVSNDSLTQIKFKKNWTAKNRADNSINYSRNDIYKKFENRNILESSRSIYQILSNSFFNRGYIHFKNKSLVLHSDSISILQSEKSEIKSFANLFGQNPLITKMRYNDQVLVINGERENYVINEELKRIDSLDFLTNKSFNSFIFDNESNLWLCDNTGITYINQNAKAAKHFTLDDSEDSYVNIITDQNNDLIIATKNGSIIRFGDEEELDEIVNFDLDNLNRILLDTLHEKLYLQDLQKGMFYMSLDNHVYDEDSLHPINTYNSKSIKDYTLGKSDQLFLASSAGALIYKKDEINKIFNKRSYSILVDGESIYIGTTEGLFESDGENIEQIDSSHFNQYIHRLYQDDFKNLYILSNKSGLWYKNGDHIEIIKGTENLFVNDMISDDWNSIWLATTTGLYSLDLNANNSNSLRSYGNSYGITDQNIIDVVQAEDKVYAISEKRLYCLPMSQNTNQKKSKFYFNDLAVNNTIRDNDYIQDLSYSENNIEISFTTISFTDLGDFSYQWKLIPTSTEWQVTKENTLLFNSLSAGEYELLVSAFDSDGIILHENQKLSFIINKPWYATNLFFILLLCALCLLYYFVDRQRQLIQKKKADEKNEIQRQFYELRLKAVQAQMNPHFIFNALNSIQKFIYKKSPEEANQYIVKFSKLMRMILDSTNKNYSSLQEEIDLLHYYVSLEQLRFEHSFDYSMECSNDINTEELLIPSTLLQPFVENAINHGLAAKKGQGNLWLRFNIKDNQLIAEVEDDGIGREKAKELKNGKHISRALNIINERQKILLQRDNYKLDFHYEDKVDENKLNTGTKLTLSVPLIYD